MMPHHAQTVGTTATNRYPDIFRTVAARIAERSGAAPGRRPLRILSYGCSTGEELRSLRAYFPDAVLFGCDTNTKALHLASTRSRDDEFVLFESTPDAVRRNGPYDVIFAMSVLCRAPDSKHVDNLEPLFPFAAYQHHAVLLTQALRSGGIICIHNSNYLFSQSEAYSAFRPVRSALLHSNGFVDKFNCDGRRLSRADDLRPHYHHDVVLRPDNLSTEDFRDCIFELSDDRTPHEVELHYPSPDDDETPGNLEIRWGKPPELLLGRGWIGSFQEIGYTSKGDELWRYRRWCFSTLDREVSKLRPLWDLMPYGNLEEADVFTSRRSYSDPAPMRKKRNRSSIIKRAMKIAGWKV